MIYIELQVCTISTNNSKWPIFPSKSLQAISVSISSIQQSVPELMCSTKWSCLVPRLGFYDPWETPSLFDFRFRLLQQHLKEGVDAQILWPGDPAEAPSKTGSPENYHAKQPHIQKMSWLPKTKRTYATHVIACLYIYTYIILHISDSVGLHTFSAMVDW